MLDLSRYLHAHDLEARGVRLGGPADLMAILTADPDVGAILLVESDRLLPRRLVLPPLGAVARRLRRPRRSMGHWTLVEGVSGERIRLRDPDLGRIEFPLERLRQWWDGMTLLVRPPTGRARGGDMNGEPGDRGPAVAVLENVTRVYDRRLVAVRQVNWELRAGEIFCLLGPNGAGKSTLVKLLTGILPPTSGRIRIDGLDLACASEDERTAIRRSIGYLPEQQFLHESLTAVEYLEFVGRLCGAADLRVLRSRIDEELRFLNLEEKANERIGTLSLGMRRKIAIIAAGLHEPRLLLLDEPTSGLDPASARRVKDRLEALRDRQYSIVVTTHVLEIAERLADRVGVLDQGVLRFVGTLAEMRSAAGLPGATLEELFLRLTEPAADGIPADPERAAETSRGAR